MGFIDCTIENEIKRVNNKERWEIGKTKHKQKY